MGIELNENVDHVAKAFVDARHAARALPVYPGIAPHNLAAAYTVQDRAIAIDGRVVAGWKVGRINVPLDSQLGANRLAGPIFADSIVDAAAGDTPHMPVFAGGFAAAEAEMLLHVAPGFQGPVPTDDAGTIAILDDVRVGIEMASSPYPGINTDGPLVTVSDFGNNAGLVRGAAIDGWQTLDLCAIVVRSEIDGVEVGAATAATMLDGPYGAVRFLLANLMARGFDVSEGLWVSTGAITGVHDIAVGQSFRAIFEGCSEVRCSVVAASPR
ncbi:MAG: 2-keto-4-pentenoate hydratase [Novosphingobium sp. 28-62-57]|uniref:2-keto-4-pentenoate hydratase n=1 Tax=unclassified Novosphingobium TaxID=2644732 RepID=UPI000BD5E579|nr:MULTISPECIES: 2-keto-4-pentenoate hydratase [unclassified Novosphingobium]OYW51505.1 MAG: 2-keto-4-pentenoate hydratase [Novosphingobium sp. 12-62-10]OYZ43442.1 MAG: 2-keto-4-pentenoate hydratase [Novosphingobium sp. 16-62-11]OZA40748.1 MAG: 2-keto-4-pentenoate hydratase [Novosphingobium sp. 17-62-9]OYZ10609.1 MAG: 2-keto-4-pentenoate hydratase [Novosphingobium sp. 28-62-57]HQS68112.1 2-keto-4-pentenoate hydratase [Novosphingobium sp.]